MSKKKLYLVAGILVALIIILVALSKSGVIGDNKKGTEVETQAVAEKTIVETVSATGKVQPEIEIKISSEVSGEIIELPVKEGQVVKKGQLLVKINPDLYTSGLNRSESNLSGTKAGLSQAEAQFAEAKSNYQRNKTLFEKGIISRSDWEKAISSFEVAKANRQSSYYNVQSAVATVNEARDNLGRTNIYAPADGTISVLGVELGERVLGTQQMTGTELLRVANLNNMEVEVDVNENDIVKIKLGDSADVAVDAYTKKKFKGLVTSISNSATTTQTADQVTNFKVKVRIVKSSYEDLLEGKPGNYSPFRPGMTATVDIITKKSVDVVAVPISAVVMKTDTTSATAPAVQEEPKKTAKADKKLECVFIEDKGIARLRVVTTGIQDDSHIEIRTGLKAGEKVITGPYTTVSKELNPGDKVISKGNDDPKKAKS